MTAETSSGDEPVAPERESPVREQADGGALGALKTPLYARFWAGLTLGLTGTWVRITAMGYLAYELTNDEFKLGLIAFATAGPVLVTGIIAGAILDRVDRRMVMLGVQVINIVAMMLILLLIVTDRVAYWHLVTVSVAVGAASGFDWPARFSIVPSLVPRPRLQSAIALNAASFNASRILGPTAAGWLIGAFGIAACFGFTAASFIPFAIVLLTMGSRAAKRDTANGDARQSGLATLIEGYKYIWRHSRIRSLISVDVVPLALGMAYFAMAPAIARDVLGLESTGLGYLLAANGVGALTGTALVATMTGIRNRGRVVLAGVGFFGVLLIGFALSTNVYLSFVLILLLGLATATYSTLNTTILQLSVDDQYMGRVMAVYTMMWGLTPIGGLQVGAMSRWIGVQEALAVNGVLILCYGIFLWLKTPVRHID